MRKRIKAMKRINRSVQRTRDGVVLPDDACPECGTPMKEKKGRLKLPVNGEEIAVPEATHLSCPKCHEVVLRFDDARKLRQRALEIYRAKYGLLSADEIRSIRERFRLTQAELARLLRLGGNTISRWEAGRNVQTASMDMLLRMIRDLPGSLDYLQSYTVQTTLLESSFNLELETTAAVGHRTNLAIRDIEAKAHAFMFIGVMTPEHGITPVPAETNHAVLYGELGFKLREEFSMRGC